MKATELREMSVQELRDKESALAEQLFALRLQTVTGQLDNPSKIGAAKRDLARVLTVLRERASEGTQGTTANESEEQASEGLR